MAEKKAVPIKEFQDELNRANRVFHECFKESDRAAAVLVGAELDRVVLAILESHLLPRCEFSAPLLERNGPMEAFGVRIEVAFRMGLIPPTMHHDLQLLRKIRNEFAHGPTGLDFDQPPVKELALKLVAGRQQIEKMVAAQKQIKQKNVTSFEPRNMFRLTASLLLGHLSILKFQIPTINPLWPGFFGAPTPSSEAPKREV